MGQVLGFAHCKESPSTVSTTPDSTPSSTEGGNESDFPDLHTAREFSDDEEETSVDWGTPQQSSCELTFSYITFSGSTEGDVNMGHRRDSFSGELAHSDRENRVRRQRRHKSSGLMRTETTETFISELSENTSFTLHQFHGFDADNQFYLDNLGSEEQHSLSGWDPTICFIDEPECPQSELAADDVKIKEYSQYLKHTWRETKGGSPFEKDSGITVTEIHPVCSEVFPGTETPPQSIEETVSLCRITPIHLPLADSGDKSKSNQDAPSDVITDDSGHNIVQPRPDSLLSEALSQPGATVYMDILSKESPTLPPAFNTLGCNQDRFSDDEEDVKYWLENEPFILSHHMHSDQSGNILKIRMLVADLLYWKDLKTSAIVLTGLMLVLLSLSQFSVITVVSYVTLLVLCATVSLRVYKKILQALHKSDGANPFQEYLDMDMFVSKEQLQKYVETIILYFASLVKELRRLILVEDLVDSIKFAVLMWLLTFIGAVFNGLTILILAVISMFTIPLLYRQHQAQIDQYVGLVTAQISDIRAKIQAKLPSAKSKAE